MPHLISYSITMQTWISASKNGHLAHSTLGRLVGLWRPAVIVIVTGMSRVRL